MSTPPFIPSLLEGLKTFLDVPCFLDGNVTPLFQTSTPADKRLPLSAGALIVHIDTGICQGKLEDQNFPGFENPQVHHSDSTLQYSVGPMTRSYSRYVPILRTFFITEFRGPGAPF